MFDPIVDEIRSTREKLAMVAGGDIHSIAMAARQRQELAGTKTVTRPARSPEPSRNNRLQSSVSSKDTSSSAAG